MSYHKIVAADAVKAGVLQADEIEDARSKLPAAVFRELYEAEASDDGGNPFGLNYIKKIIKPISKKKVVAWGWDLAKSVDWTVGIGLDKDGDIAAFERWQGPWEDTIRKIKGHIGQLTPTYVDSTGVGDPIVEMLQKDRNNVEGYNFSSISKQKLMEGLAVVIQQEKTSVLDGEHHIHRLELESFEYEYKANGVRYSAPEGMTDDTVCAHALAAMRLLRGDDLGIWSKLGGLK
jgi:hypothetical protein